jgi:hypothetical protein
LSDTTKKPWGAAAEEWTHFADKLNLREDLLPVVSNPKAEISPNSKMRDLGKTPSRFDKQHQVVGIPQWTQNVSSERDIARWQRDSDLGICLQTRVVRAFDIDIDDPVHSQAVQDMVELALGSLPVRSRNNTGKRLLAFNMAGEFAKRIIRTEHGAIEFLATGQQFIAIGTHPSGVHYEWEGGLPSSFPEVTPAEFEVVWQALVEAFALEDGDVRTRNGLAPVKPRLRDDIQDPAVAYMQDNGWVKEWGRDGRIHVTCPWEDHHTTDTGPSASSWFPAGVGGFAQGHYKCLHAHCASRTDGDFLEAIGYLSEDFENLPAVVGEDGEEGEPWPAFTRDRQGRIESTAGNVQKALMRPDIGGARIAYDQFKDLVLVAYTNDSQWRPLRDTDYFRLRIELEKRGFKSPGSDIIREGVHHVAEVNEFDSAIEWAKGLTWDGVPRVEGFLHNYFGTEHSDYAKSVSVYLWSALAGRCLEPGVKADMTPILVGDQGAGKTRGVSALSPEEGSFVEVNLEHRDDNLARSLRGKLIGELGELRGLMTREAESIKAWMTRTHEEWIPKYREFATRFPRRLVFIGTTNDDEFLGDATGERRWLPIRVGKVDVAAIERDRDQLWAEGIELFKREGVQWRNAQHLAKDEHANYKVHDTWETAIGGWLESDDMDGQEGVKRGDRPFKLQDIMVSALGMNVQNIARKDELRAGRVLRTLGFEKRAVREGSHFFKGWVRAKNCTLGFDDLA